MAKTKPIPVRLSEDMRNLIIDYAAFFGLSTSEALRDIIKEGLMTKSYIGLLKRWQEKIKQRNPMLFLNKCDKCGSEKNLMIHHIDRNIRNFETENLSVLCQGCISKLNRYTQKFNPREKFAAWFFYE